jgi:hypothetical protein
MDVLQACVRDADMFRDRAARQRQPAASHTWLVGDNHCTGTPFTGTWSSVMKDQ